jgi:hypothetical protein
MIRLYLALDKLRYRYGRKSVLRAVGISNREESMKCECDGSVGVARIPADGSLPEEVEQRASWQMGGSTFQRLWKINRPDYLTGNRT